MQGSATGGQNRAGSGMASIPGPVPGGAVREERRGRGRSVAAHRDLQAVVRALWEEQGAQPIVQEDWGVKLVEEQEEAEEEEEEVEEAEEAEEDEEKKEEAEEGDRDKEEDKNYVDKEEEEEDDPPEGRELDSAADVKSGNVVHHLVMLKSVSFDTKEESEHRYENADEEKEDGNEKPEEGPKLDMVSAEGSSGEYSWKA
ncbi:cilia- and flagella-associated protein 251-like isoform X2 [Lagenorhynchus albirostris]|uniref:cilia- and flagella-associated protein 251-like isoform X2 n=1 Tax=Lagenorhynchus albirostris TaxID=27610 RepID=UPI0028EF9009|nr:cilia- and flagella-associated protein 251-like isoform X2 [Lagenorhynchus albirostris]